jgi:hypothetical protein
MATLSLAASVALAGDRPFLATSSAAAEEDDDAVWALETAFQRTGSQRELSVAVEYAFDPVNAIQFEFARSRDRTLRETAQGAGIEFKHLFNHIARDGYGVGVIVAADFARPASAGWRGDAWSVVLPFTLQLGTGAGLLHANVGLVKPRDAARQWSASLAVEHEVVRRTVLFAELAREADARLLHGGVRYWLQREKLAIDLSLLQSRSESQRRHGLVLGLGWHDL